MCTNPWNHCFQGKRDSDMLFTKCLSLFKLKALHFSLPFCASPSTFLFFLCCEIDVFWCQPCTFCGLHWALRATVLCPAVKLKDCRLAWKSKDLVLSPPPPTVVDLLGDNLTSQLCHTKFIALDNLYGKRNNHLLSPLFYWSTLPTTVLYAGFSFPRSLSFFWVS